MHLISSIAIPVQVFLAPFLYKRGKAVTKLAFQDNILINFFVNICFIKLPGGLPS